jgi:hypothetical protein
VLCGGNMERYVVIKNHKPILSWNVGTELTLYAV